MLGNKEVMAKNLKKYLDLNGKTATDVCSVLGFKRNTFSDWINAKTYPRIDKIEMMANYFGISKADLVEESPKHDYPLSRDEIELIDRFRSADKMTKESIKRLLAYAEILQKG